MFVQGSLTFKFDKSSTNFQCFIFQFGGLGALFGKAKPTKAPVATGLCRRRAGARLQRRHTHAVFEYGCEIDRIVTGDTQTCALGAASASIPLLFKSLLPNCKPMLVKCRNFNLEDREVLIKSFPSFKRRYQGIISFSLAAQVVVVNDGEEKKRMCFDYSQTINLYTQCLSLTKNRFSECSR